MARSNYLVIPDAVKDALRATAGSESERSQVTRIIAEGEKAERQKLAISLQNSVFAELKTGNLKWATQDVNAFDEPDPKAGLGKTEPKYYGRGSAILADLALNDPAAFTAVVDRARAAL